MTKHLVKYKKSRQYEGNLMLTLLLGILIFMFSPASDSKDLNEKDKFVEAIKAIEPVVFCGTPRSHFQWGCVWIYPFGFSKKSGFAYTNITTGNPAGDYWSFSIMDLVSDKGLDGDCYEEVGKDEKIPTLENTGLVQFVKINKEKIFKLLQKHQITVSNTLKLKTFPIKWKDDELNVSYVKEGEKSSESYTPIKISIQLQSKKKGWKNIGKYDGLTDDKECCDVLGYFQSPFEERIAVLIGTKWRDEGNLMGDFMVIGADLNKGFSKVK